MLYTTKQNRVSNWTKFSLLLKIRNLLIPTQQRGWDEKNRALEWMLEKKMVMIRRSQQERLSPKFLVEFRVTRAKTIDGSPKSMGPSLSGWQYTRNPTCQNLSWMQEQILGTTQLQNSAFTFSSPVQNWTQASNKYLMVQVRKKPRTITPVRIILIGFSLLWLCESEEQSPSMIGIPNMAEMNIPVLLNTVANPSSANDGQYFFKYSRGSQISLLLNSLVSVWIFRALQIPVKEIKAQIASLYTA